MSKLSRLFMGQRNVTRESRPEETWLHLIETEAPRRSFIDVGCLWNVHGRYAFHAVTCGASPVVGIDVAPATPEFIQKNEAHGNCVRFVQADINSPALDEVVGTFDMVFCSGVLYHMPNPLFTLQQLKRICHDTLLVTSAIIAERKEPQSAIFYPYLPTSVRARFSFPTVHRPTGVDLEFRPERSHGNWFWGLTPSCVRAMLKVAGFEVVSFEQHRFVCTALCRLSRP